ncbi:MAG: cytochrome C, partial [Desulfuromonas sp.]
MRGLKLSGALFVGLFFAGEVFAGALTPMQELGKKIFFDKISSPDWVACANCHDPSVGWTG